MAQSVPLGLVALTHQTDHDCASFPDNDNGEYRDEQHEHEHVEHEELVPGHVQRVGAQVRAAMLDHVFNPPGGLVLRRHLGSAKHSRSLSNVVTVTRVCNQPVDASDHLVDSEVENVERHSKPVVFGSPGVVVLLSEQRHADHRDGVVERLELTVSAAVSDEEPRVGVAEQVLLGHPLE